MLRVYYDNLANTIATGLRNPGDSSVFVDFLYALETMHAATILLVGRPFMTVGAALHRFHSRTKNRYRLNVYVYMRLVRRKSGTSRRPVDTSTFASTATTQAPSVR